MWQHPLSELGADFKMFPTIFNFCPAWNWHIVDICVNNRLNWEKFTDTSDIPTFYSLILNIKTFGFTEGPIEDIYTLKILFFIFTFRFCLMFKLFILKELSSDNSDMKNWKKKIQKKISKCQFLVENV